MEHLVTNHGASALIHNNPMYTDGDSSGGSDDDEDDAQDDDEKNIKPPYNPKRTEGLKVPLPWCPYLCEFVNKKDKDTPQVKTGGS